MRTITLLAVLLTLAGCAANRPDQPPPEHVVGKYVFNGNGSVAGHPWKLNAHLILERDGQYTLDMQVDVADEKERETSFGTFYVDGDRIVLDPADDMEHDDLREWTLRGDRLSPRLGWPARLALKGLKVEPVFVKSE